MDYKTEVLINGKDSHLLLNCGTNPESDPLLEGIRTLEEGWTPKKLAQHNDDYIEASSLGGSFSFDLRGIWRQIKGWYITRGPVKNITNNLCMLIGCPEASFKSDQDKERWAQIAKENGFPNRWSKIIRNTALFNDYFTWIGKSKTISDEKPVGVKIRNFEPFHIEKILHEDGDPETPTGYQRSDSKDKKYDPEEIVHHVLDSIGNEDRGVPLLNCCLRELKYYYSWMEDLYYLGHVRARMPVIREVQGGQSAVSAEASRNQYLPGPGRMLLQNQGYKTTFPPSYSGVGDAEPGIMIFLRGIALSVNLPLFLVTSDYTNNSLASTLSADSPTVRLIRDYRNQLAPGFRTIVERVMLTDEFELTWPPIIERDKEKDSKAYQIGITSGALSPQDMCEDVFGKSWEDVSHRIQTNNKDRAREWGMGAASTGGPGS